MIPVSAEIPQGVPAVLVNDIGAGIRQLSRLTGVSFGTIQKL